MTNKQATQYTNLLSKYTLGAQLGEGGNAEAVRCTRLSDGTNWVVKRLVNRSEEKKQRFLDEIDVMQRCAGIPGVMPIVDADKSELWYVMPEAMCLETFITEADKYTIPLPALIQGFEQLCDTIRAVHALGYAHRDIKPANIYVTEQGRFLLGDFGIVDIPDNPAHLTKTTNMMGAKFTMAPEVMRYPKQQSMPGDVYSLAKSLWMVMMKDMLGFDGQYDILDDKKNLHSRDEWRDVHLVEIHEALRYATEYDPTLRPTPTQFKKFLTDWETTRQSPFFSQLANWKYLKQILFPKGAPSSVSYTDPVTIVEVLNTIASLPLAGYMFHQERGDLDFHHAEIGMEPGTVDIITGPFRHRIKPRALHYECFPRSEWDYFLLEGVDVAPAVGDQVSRREEYVVEDTPGHYVSAIDATYGVYDYDSGKPFPKGWREVFRVLLGNILIILKDGPYNHISEANDGRHSRLSPGEFKHYIEALIALNPTVPSGSNWSYLKQPIKRFNPAPQSPQSLPPALPSVQKSPFDWKTANFKDILNGVGESKEEGKAEYRFDFHPSSLDLSNPFKSIILCKDGSLAIEGNPEAYVTRDRLLAQNILQALNDKMAELVDEGSLLEGGIFRTSIKRVDLPSHSFTREEIYKMLSQADDRELNILVIDEDGYPRLIHDSKEKDLYPVSYRIFHPRNREVGKYAIDLDETVEAAYQDCLSKWQEYLKS